MPKKKYLASTKTKKKHFDLRFEIVVLKTSIEFVCCSYEEVKPVTDEQVFYDKFLYDKFYLPSVRVYVRQILYDKFLVF